MMQFLVGSYLGVAWLSCVLYASLSYNIRHVIFQSDHDIFLLHR